MTVILSKTRDDGKFEVKVVLDVKTVVTDKLDIKLFNQDGIEIHKCSFADLMQVVQ